MSADQNDLSITALRRQMDQRRIIDNNIHNLAKAIFTEDLKVEYVANAGRHYFGAVVLIVGVPGDTKIRVRNLQTDNVRDVQIADIVGIVREN